MPTPFTCEELIYTHRMESIRCYSIQINAAKGAYGAPKGRVARGKIRRAARAVQHMQRALRHQGRECKGCQLRYFGKSEGCDRADRSWWERASGPAEVLRQVRRAVIRKII